MNAVYKKLAVLSLAVFAPLAAWAATDEQAYLATVRTDPGVPVPVKVVAPEASSYSAGESVDLVFVVDVAGVPADVTVQKSTDSTLADAAVSAVKQWRFTPATRDGHVVATKVLLPVRVLAADSYGSGYAAN